MKVMEFEISVHWYKLAKPEHYFLNNFDICREMAGAHNNLMY
jgi:hypothetical protein